MLYPKQTQWFYDIWDLFFSIARMLVSSSLFRRTIPFPRKNKQCLILGNGPSLLETLEVNKSKIADCDVVVVNHFASAPEYEVYQPFLYVMCDPIFWQPELYPYFEPKVKKTFQCLIEKTTWDCFLYMPIQAKKSKFVQDSLAQNDKIHLRYFNKTKFDGSRVLRDFLMNRQLVMPRPQNILIAATALALYSKYDKIYLAGSDSNWIANSWVDENNNVRQDDIHFYKEGKEIEAKIFPGKFQDELLSVYYAMDSYQILASYAQRCTQTQIYNLCITSFVDAFPKQKLIK